MKKLALALSLLLSGNLHSQVTLNVELALNNTKVNKTLVLEQHEKVYEIDCEQGILLEAISMEINKTVVVVSTITEADETGARFLIAQPVLQLVDGKAVLELIDEQDNNALTITATT